MKVILVIVDCMRWDYMSHNGYPRPTTPNIDRIAEMSSTFDRAYATINQTDQSLTSIFSGFYPLSHGLERPAVSLPSQDLLSLNAWKMQYLPQLLQGAGYLTFGVDWLDRWHQWGYDWYWSVDESPGWAWRLRRTAARVLSRLPKAALDVANSMALRANRLSKVAALKPGVSADIVTARALEILRDHRDNDLFLMLHYWDVHAPYDADLLKPYQDMCTGTFPGEEHDLGSLIDQTCHPEEFKHWIRTRVARNAHTVGDAVAQYCASLRAVDEQIGQLFRFIEENHMLDQTAFVITSDHGENLFEHGYLIEHTGVRENIVHIPMIIRLPGIEASRVEQVVSHVDIVPTLGGFLGLEVSPKVDGLDLVPLMTERKPLDRRHIFFQSHTQEPDPRWGIITKGNHKYVESRSPVVPACSYCGMQHAPQAELYDLSRNPLGGNNLTEAQPELYEQLSAELEEAVGGLREKSAALGSDSDMAADAVYSDTEKRELEQRLRSLGYLD